MRERRRSTEPDFLIPPLFDDDGVQVSSAIGPDGREYPDPVPMSPPIGYEPPSTLEMLIESVIQRRDFLKAVREADFETPEEADDFDVDEDEDTRFPETVYEAYFEAKSRRAAAEAARQAEANQRASAGLVSERSAASSARTVVGEPSSDSRDRLVERVGSPSRGASFESGPARGQGRESSPSSDNRSSDSRSGESEVS